MKKPVALVPTRAHFVLWAYRNRPQWAREITLPIAGASIDSIINARTGKKKDETDNALALLSLVRHNHANGHPSPVQYMRDFPQRRQGPDRGRAAQFARWVRRFDKAQKRDK